MSTTLSDYTTSDRTDHERAKSVIMTALTNGAVGKANAIPSGELAEMTAERNCAVSASTVRDLVPEVRREYRLPIGSSNGYFIIDSQEEFVKQVERQKRQAETSLQTARDIAAGWNQTEARHWAGGVRD